METPLRVQRHTKGRYSEEEKRQLIANLDLEGKLYVPRPFPAQLLSAWP